ncbi:unnamed protein product [Mesocestoides corti]|uniref:RPAP3_C domain-containing protein n=1 Tax=Mesocestoides corti TaxID=53468 RepID=A0A0R3UBP0_MESCO|nr:unnamed protein product [Mesocestoides corti]
MPTVLLADVFSWTSLKFYADNIVRVGSERALFFFLEALENFGLADRIANLILTLNLPFEFLIKALILLLNGRVSSLINPPPNPAPAQSSLVKLSISDGSRKQLVSWLDSVKAQKDSLIDTETLDELAKALH